MNTMNMPGFTAAGSLYRTNGHYRRASAEFNPDVSVVPAICFDDWCHHASTGGCYVAQEEI